MAWALWVVHLEGVSVGLDLLIESLVLLLGVSVFDLSDQSVIVLMEFLVLVLDLNLVDLSPALKVDHVTWTVRVVHLEGVSVSLDLLVKSLVLLLRVSMLDLGNQSVIVLMEGVILNQYLDLVDLIPGRDGTDLARAAWMMGLESLDVCLKLLVGMSVLLLAVGRLKGRQQLVVVLMEFLIVVLNLGLVLMKVEPIWKGSALARAFWVLGFEGVSVGLDLVVDVVVLFMSVGAFKLGDQGIVVLVEVFVLVLDMDLVFKDLIPGDNMVDVARAFWMLGLVGLDVGFNLVVDLSVLLLGMSRSHPGDKLVVVLVEFLVLVLGDHNIGVDL